MEEQLTKKYGLPTAIAMVIGIVIGSGIFFKAEKILTATGGDLKTGILAWLLGGCIAIASACAFAVMATRYEKVGGVVDYAEATVGENYAYYLGWFMAAVYFPCLTSTLCWVSARYTCVLLGYDILSGPCLAITMLYQAGGQVPGLSHRHQAGSHSAYGGHRHCSRAALRPDRGELHCRRGGGRGGKPPLCRSGGHLFRL